MTVPQPSQHHHGFWDIQSRRELLENDTLVLITKLPSTCWSKTILMSSSSSNLLGQNCCHIQGNPLVPLLWHLPGRSNLRSCLHRRISLSPPLVAVTIDFQVLEWPTVKLRSHHTPQAAVSGGSAVHWALRVSPTLLRANDSASSACHLPNRGFLLGFVRLSCSEPKSRPSEPLASIPVSRTIFNVTFAWITKPSKDNHYLNVQARDLNGTSSIFYDPMFCDSNAAISLPGGMRVGQHWME